METKNDKPGRMRRDEVALPGLVHLRGADNIAAIFGVGRKTVLQWIKDDAPIVYIGRKYQADYNKLWDWLIANKKPGTGGR